MRARRTICSTARSRRTDCISSSATTAFRRSIRTSIGWSFTGWSASRSVFTLDALLRYPMVSRVTFVECGGNSGPLYSREPLQADVQALHGLVSCAEWTGVRLSTLLDEAGIDPKAKWLIAEGADTVDAQPQRAHDQGVGRRHGRALPERRAAASRQRLSDAAAAARLRRQHERQISASHQAGRATGHDVRRDQDLHAAPAERKVLPVQFPAGGQILHHSSVVRHDVEGSRLLRDFRHRLFGQRSDFQGRGLGRRRKELGARRPAGAGAQQGVHPFPHGVELGRRAGDPAEPRHRRGRQHAADPRRVRRRARRRPKASRG